VRVSTPLPHQGRAGLQHDTAIDGHDHFGISRSMKQISKREMSSSDVRSVAYFSATGRISPS
jgi:hypothetical protein